MYTQSKLINKNILRAGILKVINRITFLMYTQSKLISKNILRAGIPKGKVILLIPFGIPALKIFLFISFD
jgi:hypothetical protein